MPNILIRTKRGKYRVSLDGEYQGDYLSFAGAYRVAVKVLGAESTLNLETFRPVTFDNIKFRQDRRGNFDPTVDGESVPGIFETFDDAVLAVAGWLEPVRREPGEVPPADEPYEPTPEDLAQQARLRERHIKMTGYKGIDFGAFVREVRRIVPDLFPVPPIDERALNAVRGVVKVDHYLDLAVHDELAMTLKGCLPTQEVVDDECYYFERYRLEETDEDEPAAWDWAGIARDTQAAYPHLYEVALPYFK